VDSILHFPVYLKESLVNIYYTYIQDYLNQLLGRTAQKEQQQEATVQIEEKTTVAVEETVNAEPIDTTQTVAERAALSEPKESKTESKE
jgi:hypothetical protein